MVSQVTDRGYSVKEVSERLGISTKSLYDWIKQFKKPESVRLKESDEAREMIQDLTARQSYLPAPSALHRDTKGN